jgi:hypothetical protein
MFTIKSLAVTDGQVATAAAPPTGPLKHRTGEAATPVISATGVAGVAVAAAVSGRLSATQESARTYVLTRLEACPTLRRAYVTRFEGDALIVTLAIRGVGTCELSVPPDRFNRHDLADFARLDRCLIEPQ